MDQLVYLDGPNDRNLFRSTQRRPRACRTCTKNKIRCDKTIPCSRCRKRGIDCDREQVTITSKQRRESSLAQGDNAKELRNEDGFDGAIHPSLKHDSPQSCPPYVTSGAPSNKLVVASSIAGGIGPKPGLAASSDPNDATLAIRTITRVPRKRIERPRAHAEFEDLATGIEGLAWGRHQCHRYPHRSCVKSEILNSTTESESHAELSLDKLPAVEIARQLVDFHMAYLCWNHNVLHIPTFLEDCEIFWASATVEDGQWLAVYCAVLSSAAWSIQNCPDYVDDVAVVNYAHSAEELFGVVIEVLNGEDFMNRHTIHSVQAVCISGMVGNVFGKSDLLTTLVNASVRIAQCLGLHRIPGECPNEPWDEICDKEVGRRVWWKLVEMDYHSMPYTGTCCINSRHFTTRLPLNCDDQELCERDESCLTTSTYSIIMARIALLIPDLLDGLCTINDLAARYEHVIDVDRRMRTVVAKIPAAILHNHSRSVIEPEWLNLARRTLAITAADKIIMIHRSFLLKSFQSPAYLFTKTTCISAAMTILREHEQIASAGSDCPPIWVHSAFCVTAIVVICLNILYCHASMAQDTKEHYQTLIMKARTRLSRYSNNTMARRGVFLVDAMLDEDLLHMATHSRSETASRKPEFVRILDRFLQQDQQNLYSHSSIAEPDTFEPNVGDQLEDFDTWYNQIFG